MRYHLRVYDNFHYMDESEAYNHGQFETYGDATVEAKAIVIEFLKHNWKPGIKPDDLIAQFVLYGEDPIILPEEHSEDERFSARTYVLSIAEEFCRKFEAKQVDVQTLYQSAIKFATAKHLEKEQKVPGTDLPYVVHLSNVAMEIVIASSRSDNFNLGFAVQVALLHDTIEDTSASFGELKNTFGVEIAEAVSALTKNKKLLKEQQMRDSLSRIKKLPKEVWAIKLADRITNLQQPPPNWNRAKRINYQNEARIILSELKDGNNFLAKRLETKIEEYGNYINL